VSVRVLPKILIRVGISLIMGVLLAWIFNELSYQFLKTDAAREPRIITLTIPPGTGSRVSQGDNEPSLPEGMGFVIGDTLIIDNQDDVNHQLGPVFIPAGARAKMDFKTAEKFSYECSFVPDNTFGLDVQEPVTAQTRLLGAIFAGVPMGALIALYSTLLGSKASREGTSDQRAS